MAPMAKQFSFVLLVVVLFSSLLVEARDGKFFFVSLHHSHHKKSHEKSTPLETPTPAPAPAPVAGGEIDFAPVPAAFESGNEFPPAPAPAPSSGDIDFAPPPVDSGNGYAPVPPPATFESDNPYGLYGKDNEENEVLAGELSSQRFTEYNTAKPYYNNNNGYVNNNNNNGYVNNNNNNGYSSTVYNNNNGYANNYNNNGYSSTVYNNNNGYANNYNNNGYSSTVYNNGYTNNYNNKNGYSSTLYNNMGYSTLNYNREGYNNNGYESEKQGMSDTRFLENGRYRYVPSQDQNYNKNDGYASMSRSSNNEGYHGEKSQYEFDSMEEYERQQGYSP